MTPVVSAPQPYPMQPAPAMTPVKPNRGATSNLSTGKHQSLQAVRKTSITNRTGVNHHESVAYNQDQNEEIKRLKFDL